MLEAPDERFTLSTTIPLVPPSSATVGALAVSAGNPPVMLKALIQPLAPRVAEQLAVTETKRNSVPPEALGLKNSVNGEHPADPLVTS